MARYPVARSALLPMLHLVQSVQGYVSPEGVTLCAEELGLTKAEVGAVATFYTMYKRRPTGRHLVSVCTNTLCSVLGGQRIMDALQRDLGVHHDETAADGSITLEHAECLAACDYAPVVTVDYEFYDQQDVESARELVAALRRGEKPAADPRRTADRLQGHLPAARRLLPVRGRRRRAAAADRRRRRARPDARRAAAGRGARRGRARHAPAVGDLVLRRRARPRRPASSPRSAAPPSRPGAPWPTGTTAPTPLRGPSRARPARVPGRPDPCLSLPCSPPAGAPTSRGGWPPTSRSRATAPCGRRCRWRPTSSSRWSRTPACAAAAAPASRPA